MGTRTWTCCRPSSKCDALSFVAHGCDLSFRLKGCEAHVWNAFKSDPGEIQAGHTSILSLNLDPAESSRLVGVVFLLNAPSSHGLSSFETSLTPPSAQHDDVNSLEMDSLHSQRCHETKASGAKVASRDLVSP